MNHPTDTTVVYGPHCGHAECAWTACDDTGLVEYPCRKRDQGCPHCGPGSAYATTATTATESTDEQPCDICENDHQECGACDGSGDDDEDYSDWGCAGCGGSGWRVPEHCCACGGSPYCDCCRRCGASCVADCRCPIPTERDGRTVMV